MEAPAKPMIFLAMPHYTGMLHAEAAKAFWLDPVDESIDFINMDHGTSLLAKTFNDMWCHALNLRAKHGITHFGMLHSDLWAQRLWAKILLDELVATDADICAAVVPIKSREDLTSTALSGADPFRVERRLTIKEVQRLPATFDAEACGFPGRTLLANTGCWVCRFDKPWVEDVVFSIRDKIVRNEDGKYEARVEPEDWHFSRQVWQRGGKIVCTRKVAVRHYGGAAYTMDRTGGLEIDHMADKPLPVFSKPRVLAAFVFPEDVEGWLSEEEGTVLAGLAADKRVLEIGSYCGKSTICLAHRARAVEAVDPHDGRETPEPKLTYYDFRRNLDRYGVANVVQAHKTLGTVSGRFDLAFIDGNHALDAVRADIAATLPILAEGGLLAFHDYRDVPDDNGVFDEGVTKAVNELIGRGAKLTARYGTIAVVDPSGVSV